MTRMNAPLDLPSESVDQGAGPPAAAAPMWFIRWQLVLTGLVVALGRWAFAADRRIFHVYLDEPGQFAMARWMSGRQPWTLFDLDTWQPGAAILIAPLYWISDDVTTVFRLAMGLNALVGGVSAVVLALLGHRLTNMSPACCCWIAALVSLVPSALSASSQAWSEPLVTLAFLTTLLALFRFNEQPGAWRGMQATFAATAGYLAHGRLLPLVLVAAAITAGWELRQRRRSSSVSIALGTSASLALAVVFARVVQAAVWDEPGSANTIGSTIQRLGDPVRVGSSLIGQLWYQLAASALLFGFGVSALVASARGEDGRWRSWRSWRSWRFGEATITLAVTIPLVAVSVVFMAQSGRSDFAIYGRYNDAVVGPILFAGMAWLLTSLRLPLAGATRRALAWFLVFGVVTLFVDRRSGAALSKDSGISEMTAGLLPLQQEAAALDVGRVAAVAAVVALVLFAASRLQLEPRAIPWVLIAASVLVVGGAVRTYTVLRPSVNAFESASRVREVRELVPSGTTIGFHFVGIDEPTWVLTSTQRRAAQLYQAYLPEYRIVLDEGLDDDVGPYVFAPRLDPTLAEAGATPLWEASDSGMVLWREPDSRGD